MENKEQKFLSVSAIQNGTVIDHIPAGSLFNVIRLLKLDNIKENRMTFGTNFRSKRFGRKGVIKIAGKFFEDIDIDKIALIAPDAKLNIIKDYKVVEKRKVSVPDNIFAIAKCMNPKCITNHEQVTTKFSVITDNKKVALKCHYCEKITDQEHLELI